MILFFFKSHCSKHQLERMKQQMAEFSPHPRCESGTLLVCHGFSEVFIVFTQPHPMES